MRDTLDSPRISPPQTFLAMAVSRGRARALGLGPNSAILHRICPECGEWAEIISQEYSDEQGGKWERLECQECKTQHEYRIL